MTENEKIELFDKWYDENYDEWAEGEEGIALREELEQAFKSGIATLEQENAELKKVKQVKIEVTRDYKKLAKDLQEQGNQLTKAKAIVKEYMFCTKGLFEEVYPELIKKAEQFLKENE